MKRLSSGSYAMNSARRFLSTDNLRLLCHSLVHSHLSYGTIPWGAAYHYKLHRLEVIQKRCIRNVCNVSCNEHTSPLFRKLAILKLEDIYILQLCKLMYSYVHDKLSTPRFTMFSTNAEIHEYNTRQRSGQHVQKHLTFIHQGPKLWTTLSPELRIKNSSKSFTNCLKRHLIT